MVQRFSGRCAECRGTAGESPGGGFRFGPPGTMLAVCLATMLGACAHSSRRPAWIPVDYSVHGRQGPGMRHAAGQPTAGRFGANPHAPQTNGSVDRSVVSRGHRNTESPQPVRRPGFEQAENQLEHRYAGKPALRTLRGKATYYSDALAGRPTASGEPYRPADYTAAHRTLPFGTVLRVRLRGGRRVVYVRVTDRGPFGRANVILDLSRAAAERVGLLRAGIADVVVEVVEWGQSRRHRRH